MDDEQSGSTDTFSDDGVGIPEYVDYVNLVFHLASTVFVIGMGSLVISTILKTRSLHNVHNILIVNLMVADIVAVVVYAFQNTGMTISYIIGIQDPFRCDVLRFTLFPIIVIMYTFVMISVEKFIGIKYALRYKAIVTHRRVYQAIATGWITALLFKLIGLIYELIIGTEYYRYSRFGICLAKQDSFLAVLFGTIIPIVLSFSITVTLDAYLSIKAYQVYKRIQKENGEDKQASKNKLSKLLQQLKPMITLLVTILGSTAISVIIAIIFVSAATMEGTSLVEHVILPNLPYLHFSLHPLVYGLYFRKIRQPLCRRLKRMVQSCKFNRKMNSILPGQYSNGRSIQQAWM